MADLDVYELGGGRYKLTARDAERLGARPVGAKTAPEAPNKAAVPSPNKARGRGRSKAAPPVED